ncbi:hypothetical protein SERLADRAFT_380955 [Serpula lacrymans var. lacrymans S7.9]|uniref:Uncharacterized protein n=1 Tax=Serpula lacrymans var. lacrymans (strain S7.9) TaxID=578457 RepID=F8NKU4_SERL9|nr:uncharacterized protein SERLADRAFT_380955 [Serpula lacrymans var. lacrymans S7.9]EGO28813.1 hypothetical protein SERLADRAFT_380955 [Serpula lacrymans var. lacrymans S7.9]
MLAQALHQLSKTPIRFIQDDPCRLTQEHHKYIGGPHCMDMENTDLPELSSKVAWAE